MADLTVGTLRVRRKGARATGLEPLLTSIAPRREDRRVLVVRRLSLASRDPGAARDLVEDVRRRAGHPVRGPVSPDVEAVEFADEAEELSCLSRDLLDGSADDRWWWAGRMPFGAITTGDTLATLWAGSPRWVPAVLAGLEAASPGAAARAVQALGPACAGVLGAVLGEFPSQRGLLGATGADRLGQPVDAVTSFAIASPDGIQDDGSRSDPTLAAKGLAAGPSRAPATTHAEPASDARPTSDPDPALILLRLAEAVTGVDLALPRPRTLVPVPPSPWAAEPATSPDTAPDGIRPCSVIAVKEYAAAATRSDGSTHRAPRPGQQLPSSAESGAGGSSLGLPDGGEPQRGESAPPAWMDTGHVIDSQMATLLYSVNVVRRFALDRAAGPRANGWAVVESVGRWMLRRLPDAQRRVLLYDPLLPLLAELDGRAVGEPPGVRLGRAMHPVRSWLDQHEVPPETFARPGVVVVSRTHVDVVMSIEAIDLAARVSGLDQDPGWVPGLARIVLFHFEGG